MLKIKVIKKFNLIKSEIEREWNVMKRNKINFISELLWPILDYFSTLYAYSSFNVSDLYQFGIRDKKSLFNFLISGMLLFNMFWTTSTVGLDFENERYFGNLNTLMESPADLLFILIGRGSAKILDCLWIFIIYFVGMLLFDGYYFINNLSFIFCALLLGILSSILWGAFVGAILIQSRKLAFIFSFFDSPMNLFSGTSMPIDVLPLIFRMLSLLFPLTFTLKVVRYVLSGKVLTLKDWSAYLLFIITILLITSALCYIFKKRVYLGKGLD